MVDIAVGVTCTVWLATCGHARPDQPAQAVAHAFHTLRRLLRGHGHALQAIVQIGKGGTNEQVMAQVARALFDHELIKVKLGRNVRKRASRWPSAWLKNRA